MYEPLKPKRMHATDVRIQRLAFIRGRVSSIMSAIDRDTDVVAHSCYLAALLAISLCLELQLTDGNDRQEQAFGATMIWIQVLQTFECWKSRLNV